MPGGDLPLSPAAWMPPACWPGAWGRRSHQVLADSLDALGLGLEIWDTADRLLLVNRQVNRMTRGYYNRPPLGLPLETVLREQLAAGVYACAPAEQARWLAQRCAGRGLDRRARLLALAGSRWVHLYESRLPDGCLVSGWVDVTPMVGRQQALEADNRSLALRGEQDALTGLANRRRFDEALASECLRAARSAAPLGLLMVDVDHFKRYNDHYGHQAGDVCLQRVAAALAHCVGRAGELVARYGGEEFVLLLPGSDLVQAADTARRCLQRLRGAALPHAASPTSDWVSCSIGGACLRPQGPRDAAVLLRAADAALYAAKHDGRSRFRFAAAGQERPLPGLTAPP